MSPDLSASTVPWTGGSIQRSSWPSTALEIWAGTWSSDRGSATRICRSARPLGQRSRSVSSSASTCSTSSTIRISARRATSSAAQPSVRSPGHGSRQEKRDPPGRFSSAPECHFEMSRAKITRLWIIVASAVVWLSVCPDASGQQVPVRTVLALYLGEEEFPTNPVTRGALREALTSRSDIPVEYFGEFLERERFSPELASEALREYIRTKYRGRRIDLVIAMTDQVVQFALDNRQELFPDAPIVFTGLRVPNDTIRTAGPGMTGIRVSNAHGET